MTAAREGWPDRRVVVVFQPHRYSRTRDLFDEFSQVLSAADAVILTDIYAAGESPIDGIDSGAMCQSIRARGRVNPVLISSVDDIPRDLPAMLEDGDLVLLLGAGNIGLVAQNIRENGFQTEEQP
jgi:UDP-N-acetylmuramate--alanine ligase